MSCSTAPCTACPLSATQGTLNMALAWLPNANLQLPRLSVCARHRMSRAVAGRLRHQQGSSRPSQALQVAVPMLQCPQGRSGGQYTLCSGRPAILCYEV